jgi:hypothetical protein
VYIQKKTVVYGRLERTAAFVCGAVPRLTPARQSLNLQTILKIGARPRVVESKQGIEH